MSKIINTEYVGEYVIQTRKYFRQEWVEVFHINKPIVRLFRDSSRNAKENALAYIQRKEQERENVTLQQLWDLVQQLQIENMELRQNIDRAENATRSLMTLNTY